MPLTADLEQLAARVSNWGRWGADDQRGTLNLIGPDSVLRGLAAAARAGDVARFHAAPRLTPRRRLDETAAASRPVLRWRPEAARRQAAE